MNVDYIILIHLEPRGSLNSPRKYNAASRHDPACEGGLPKTSYKHYNRKEKSKKLHVYNEVVFLKDACF